MNFTLKLGVSALSLALLTGTALANDNVYSGFPVTVKDYAGKKTTSVAYTGQIARHTLHDSLKKLAGKGNGKPNPDLKAQLLSYYANKDKGRMIVAPKTKGPFVISQTGVDDISKGKDLASKTYKGVVNGMPGDMKGAELVTFWIDKTSSANKGVDAVAGYNYPQLISKFILGAVMYSQAVDNYLDEGLSAKKKPNDKAYKDGAPYTGKEHYWDEAFGYFGAPAHTLTLTPAQVIEIAKMGKASKAPADAVALADYNKDGKIDLRTEMTFGPAYYAAGFDKGGKTTYLKNITQAYLEGRKTITAAKGEKLSMDQRVKLKGYASIIEENWEQVLAEATFKYAGSVYKDMTKLQALKEANKDTSKQLGKYIKHWGELKGFSLALQTGKNNLGETASELNTLVGAGPLMPDGSQVINIDGRGNYLRDQDNTTWSQYMVQMAQVQQLMINKLGVTARGNDVTAGLEDLLSKLGNQEAAEAD
ncbi:conserved exported hypothetical protein [Candidatus Terasakiella magnetica]|uniref:DUF4856 domain-containing protein n=1 Tax=Candidatus Terasakiella magnetica TaxID=1867952 RepID=A0A1C3RFT4_9PROT|nr:DUF4856 domain-containing protein [Candidatus Terasakiella magnetica]SCA56140.1 conserved exported hypothetical protein [Candidatus Terasakiella magnetica]